MLYASVNKLFLVFLYFQTLFYSTEGKVELGQVQLTSEASERFLTKFSFSEKSLGWVTVSFKSIGKNFIQDGHRHELKWSIFTDSEWDEYLKKQKSGSLCKERIALAKISEDLLIKDGEVEFQGQQKFVPMESSHYHYFLVSDCSLEFYDAHPPVLEYNLRVLNNDSELPADEDGVLLVHCISMFGLLGVCLLCFVGLKAQYAKFGMIHLSAGALFSAICLQILASMFELIHLIQYSRDGQGFRMRYHRLPLDFLSDSCQNLSEAIVIILIISIGRGWTLIDGTTRDMMKMWSTSLIIVFFQFLLELWSRKYDDDFSTFHDLDHWPGTLLMILRCVTCGILLHYSKATLSKLSEDTDSRKFIKIFTVLAAIWLLCYPLTVLVIAPKVVPFKRHFVVTVASVLLQSIALGVMMVLFLGLGTTGKWYLKASTIPSMGGFSDDALSSNPSASSGGSHGLAHRTTGAQGDPIMRTSQSFASKMRKKVSVD